MTEAWKSWAVANHSLAFWKFAFIPFFGSALVSELLPYSEARVYLASGMK